MFAQPWRWGRVAQTPGGGRQADCWSASPSLAGPDRTKDGGRTLHVDRLRACRVGGWLSRGAVVVQGQGSVVSALRGHDERACPAASWADPMTVLRIGDVIEVDEQHYRYGTGTLVMRVTRIGGRTRAADASGWILKGSPCGRTVRSLTNSRARRRCGWARPGFGGYLMPGRDPRRSLRSPVLGRWWRARGVVACRSWDGWMAPRCCVTSGSVVTGVSGRVCRAVRLVGLPHGGRAARPSNGEG